MKNWSIILLFDESKTSSKTLTAFPFSLRILIFSQTSVILFLKMEHCPEDLLILCILWKCRSGIHETIFSIRWVLPEKVVTQWVFYCYYFPKGSKRMVVTLYFFFFSYCNSFCKQLYSSCRYIHVFLCYMQYNFDSFEKITFMPSASAGVNNVQCTEQFPW